LCVPSISWFEWHPFAITSYNNHTKTCTIHFKVRGNWTLKFSKTLGLEGDKLLPVLLPKLIVHGPFHCYPKNLLRKILIRQSPSIIIATGIGITTFSHLLSELLAKLNSRTSEVASCKCFFLFIVKHPTEVEWLYPILKELNESKSNVFIQFAFTDKQITSVPNLHFKYTLGRPNFDAIFNEQYVKTSFQSEESKFSEKIHKTNVYYSGKSRIYNELHSVCKKHKYVQLHQQI
jgi:predicted ferric reductase